MKWNLNRFYEDGQPEGAGAGGEEEMVTLKVDQETREVPKAAIDAYATVRGITAEEAVREMQKGIAGDARFREASEKAKEAEAQAAAAKSALELQRDFDAMQNNNDEGAFRRVAAKLGWNTQQIEGALQMRRQAEIRAAIGEGEGGGSPPASEGAGDGETQYETVSAKDLAVEVGKVLLPALQKSMQVGVGNLDPKLRSALVKLVESNVEGSLEKTLDSDPQLSKLLKDDDAAFASEVSQLVKEEKQRRVAAGRDMTDPSELADLVKTVRGRISRLRIGAAKTDAPFVGLGSSGSGGDALHHSDQPPKRPKGGMDDPEYDNYLINAVLDEARRGEGQDSYGDE